MDKKIQFSVVKARYRRRKPFVTNVFILIIFVMWCLTLTLSNNEFDVFSILTGNKDTATLISLGAYKGDLVQKGEWWRIITTMFLHQGLAHVLINAFCLWDFVSKAERYFGHIKVVLIYFLSSIGGILLTLLLDPTAGAVGASGALLGGMGALFALRIYYRNCFPKTRVPFEAIIILTIIGQWLFDVYVINGARYGHLGAVIVGMSLGCLFMPRPTLKIPPKIGQNRDEYDPFVIEP